MNVFLSTKKGLYIVIILTIFGSLLWVDAVFFWPIVLEEDLSSGEVKAPCYIWFLSSGFDVLSLFCFLSLYLSIRGVFAARKWRFTYVSFFAISIINAIIIVTSIYSAHLGNGIFREEWRWLGLPSYSIPISVHRLWLDNGGEKRCQEPFMGSKAQWPEVG